jgi:hypothetical protein
VTTRKDGQGSRRDPQPGRNRFEPLRSGENQVLLVAALKNDVRIGE